MHVKLWTIFHQDIDMTWVHSFIVHQTMINYYLRYSNHIFQFFICWRRQWKGTKTFIPPRQIDSFLSNHKRWFAGFFLFAHCTLQPFAAECGTIKITVRQYIIYKTENVHSAGRVDPWSGRKSLNIFNFYFLQTHWEALNMCELRQPSVQFQLPTILTPTMRFYYFICGVARHSSSRFMS